MNKNRRRIATLAVLLAGGGLLGAGVLTTQAHGQDVAQIAQSVFQGSLDNIRLGAWGSGNVEPAKEAVIIGTTGLKVTTHGMYQGGRIELQNPIDLSAAMASSQAYMRFQVRFVPGQSSTGGFGGGFGGGRGNDEGGGPPSGFGGPPPGVGGPPGGFSGYGGGSFGGSSSSSAAPFDNMRFLLTMADGSQYELVRPLSLPPSDNQDGWVSLAFPFKPLRDKMGDKPATGAAAELKSIGVFGDKFGQLYIGEINTLVDNTEISIGPLNDQILFAQQPATFVGSAEGGASTLKYSWDFNADDGIQEDAVGRVVTHTFPRSGSNGEKKYIITLTVSDVDGLKKPVSTTLETTVSD